MIFSTTLCLNLSTPSTCHCSWWFPVSSHSLRQSLHSSKWLSISSSVDSALYLMGNSLYTSAHGQNSVQRKALNINTLAASIYHTLNGNYWFLKSLFCCYLIFNILFRLSHRNTIFLVIACLLTTISTGKYSISFMFPFFCIGILLNHYSDWLQSHLKPIAYISAVLFIGMYLFWDGNYTVYQSPSLHSTIFWKEMPYQWQLSLLSGFWLGWQEVVLYQSIHVVGKKRTTA